MPMSEARKRANKKYQHSEKYQYTSVAASLKKEDAAAIKAAAEKQGLTVSKYLSLSAKYCIENNIDLTEN